MTPQELRDKKGNLANQLDEILTKAATEGRALNSEETTKFDAIDADIVTIDATLERIEKRNKMGEPVAKPITSGKEETRNGRPAVTRGEFSQFDAVRGWLVPEEKRTDHMREAARRAGVNLSAREINISLPAYSLKGTDKDSIREWEQRAQGVGSGSIGGYTVADEQMQALERAMLEFGGMRQAARVIRTETGADLPFPMLDDTSNKGALLSENTQVSEVALAFGQTVLQSYKFSSKLVLVSVELLQDSSINAAEVIGSALGERLGRITNDYYTTGTGSSQPGGVVNASTLGATGTTGQTATIIYNDFIDLEHSVDPAYRNGARFMFNDATLKVIKKIRVPQFSGDTAGQPLWQPGLASGSPNTILGYPYTINQSMASMAADAKSVLFGDFSKFVIRDVRGFTLVRLDERYADYHQVGFLAFLRTDSDLLDAGTHPIKHYVNSSS
jgi:HK97 family phage major capsid protein